MIENLINNNQLNPIRLYASGIIVKLDLKMECTSELDLIKFSARGSFRMGPKKSALNIESTLNKKDLKIHSHSIRVPGFSMHDSYKQTESGDLQFSKKGVQTNTILPALNSYEPLSLLYSILKFKEPNFSFDQILLGGKIRLLNITNSDQKIELNLGKNNRLEILKKDDSRSIYIPQLRIRLNVEYL